MNKPVLQMVQGRFCVAQLSPDAPLPVYWDQGSSLFCMVRTEDEVSVVCDEACVPANVPHEAGWAALKVVGPLDFSLVGILAGIANSLTQAEISIFAISTYNTDYILFKESLVSKALQALKQAGYILEVET